MDVEVFLIAGETAWTINDSPYDGWGTLLGLYAASRHENKSHEDAWLYSLGASANALRLKKQSTKNFYDNSRPRKANT